MEKRRRPRALTLTLPDAKQPFLVLAGKKYTLRNFSQEGIGLWVPPPAPFGLALGTQISGDVVIENNIHPVQLQIRHLSPGLVGLLIVGSSPELRDLFHRLMKPAIYASELVAHPKSGTEDAAWGVPRLWYVDQGTSELLVWYNGFQHAILGVQLVWLGKWIARRQFQASQTGFLSEESGLSGSLRGVPDLIVQHPDADPELLSQAAQFLTAVPPPLPGHLLWQFLETGEQVFLPPDILKKVEVA